MKIHAPQRLAQFSATKFRFALFLKFKYRTPKVPWSFLRKGALRWRNIPSQDCFVRELTARLKVCHFQIGLTWLDREPMDIVKEEDHDVNMTFKTGISR